MDLPHILILLRLALHLLWHIHSQHSIPQSAIYVLQVGILRQAEPPREASSAALHAVPLIVGVLTLLDSLPAYLEYVAVFHLHLEVLFPHPRKISTEDVSIISLTPVNMSMGKSRSLVTAAIVVVRRVPQAGEWGCIERVTPLITASLPSKSTV